MEYFLLLFYGLCFTLQYVFKKFYQKRSAGGMLSGAFFCLVYGAFSVILFMAVNGFRFEITKTALLYSFIYAVSAIICQFASISAMGRGKIATVSMFAMSGCLVLPFVFGIAFLHESATWQKCVGAFMMVLSFGPKVLYERRPNPKTGKGFLPLCLLVMFTNGTALISSKLHQISPKAVSTTQYILLYSALILFLSAVILLPMRKKGEPMFEGAVKPAEYRGKAITASVLFVFGYSVMNGSGSFLMLQLAKTMPASVQFPILSAITVILSALFSRLFFKEKPNKPDMISIGMNLIGILFFL